MRPTFMLRTSLLVVFVAITITPRTTSGQINFNERCIEDAFNDAAICLEHIFNWLGSIIGPILSMFAPGIQGSDDGFNKFIDCSFQKLIEHCLQLNLFCSLNIMFPWPTLPNCSSTTRNNDNTGTLAATNSLLKTSNIRARAAISEMLSTNKTLHDEVRVNLNNCWSAEKLLYNNRLNRDVVRKNPKAITDMQTKSEVQQTMRKYVLEFCRHPRAECLMADTVMQQMGDAAACDVTRSVLSQCPPQIDPETLEALSGTAYSVMPCAQLMRRVLFRNAPNYRAWQTSVQLDQLIDASGRAASEATSAAAAVFVPVARSFWPALAALLVYTYCACCFVMSPVYS